MEPTIVIEVYEKTLATPSQRWRWRAKRTGNNRKMANGGEGYGRKADLIYALKTLWPGDAGRHIMVCLPDVSAPLTEIEEHL